MFCFNNKLYYDASHYILFFNTFLQATCEQLALFEEKLKAVIPVTKKSSEEELR